MSNTANFNIGTGLTPAEVNTLKGYIDAMMVILSPHLVNLTPKQIKDMRNLGKRRGYVNEMQSLATEQGSNFLPSNFNMAQFNTIVGYLDSLGEVDAHQIAFAGGMRDTLQYYGNIAMEFSEHVYQLSKTEAERGNTALGAATERTKRIFKGQGQRGHTKDFEARAGATLTVDNVSKHSPFHNIGSTVLLVKKANQETAVASTQRTAASAAITVQPGTHIKLPADFTMISVTNLNTTTDGMFSVKVRALKK
ncbi:MAG: hypothetical protein ACYDCN_03555 [Bacteroidia bacterium]